MSRLIGSFGHASAMLCLHSWHLKHPKISKLPSIHQSSFGPCFRFYSRSVPCHHGSLAGLQCRVVGSSTHRLGNAQTHERIPLCENVLLPFPAFTAPPGADEAGLAGWRWWRREGKDRTSHLGKGCSHWPLLTGLGLRREKPHATWHSE